VTYPLTHQLTIKYLAYPPKKEKPHSYLVFGWDVELDHGKVVFILCIPSLVDTMGDFFFFFVEICWHIDGNGSL